MKSQNLIDISVEALDKKFIKLKAEETDFVSSILKTLRNEHGIPSKYSLVFKLRELDPTRTLKSYQIGAKLGGANLKLLFFEKRDELKHIENVIQSYWKKEKVFEENAPEDKQKPKFMATFPFPYVNGTLHCGHGFSLTKADFACGYQRLKGKNVLFPFGFHCTGMPIVASANKLKKELEKGIEKIEAENLAAENLEKSPKKNEGDGGKKKIKKKGKLAGKTSAARTQFQIMRELGISEKEIPEFADPYKWVNYFTPLCVSHLQRFGCKVDLRRAFVTAELNPLFGKFVEWQFRLLKKKNLLRFGNRMCVFSPIDGQPCADHDRQKGEGVQPQEYTAVKMKAHIDSAGEKENLQWIKEFAGKDLFLLAGTLRPETMYAQTNCFVKPNGEYTVVKGANENEFFVCSEQSAKNLSYQSKLPTRGEVKILKKVKGWDLLGLKVSAPNSLLKDVYVMPLLNILMNKATGVVTSVPSDSPDDYINYMEIKTNKKYREKYLITEKMIESDVIPVIEIPGYSNTAAADVCKKFKVKSPNDEKNLKLAKAEVYTKGYYKGKMLIGPYKGMAVEEAKDKVKKDLIDYGDAFSYFEPTETVVSRSGDVCVVAETEQWFIHYGEEPFKSIILEHINSNMDFYSEATRKCFTETVNWMKQWACSRKFGLGTKLPFDKNWLIESLSDSTIYMAYYTISHFLNGKVQNTQSDKRLDVKTEDLSDEVFDYIFLEGEMPSEISDKTNGRLTENALKQMREEFNYWYPLDLRVSGKDLINNHLVMALYNHAFIWDKCNWPRSMYANGHALINAEKMSKSTGNFITLIDCIEQYGADATRMTFADAGDGLEDANFSSETCNAAIIRLSKELAWIKDCLEVSSVGNVNCDNKNSEGITFKETNQQTFLEKVFENEINEALKIADEAYSQMKFRVALNSGFYYLQSCKNTYVSMCGSDGLDKATIERYIDAIMHIGAPIISHWSEHLWKATGKEGSIFRRGKWPKFAPVDKALARKWNYIKDVRRKIRLILNDQKARLAHKKVNEEKPLKCFLFFAKEYQQDQQKVIKQILATSEDMKINLDEIDSYDSNQFSRKVFGELKKQLKGAKKAVKGVMTFTSVLMKEVAQNGKSALELEMPFDEREVLNEHKELICKGMEAEFSSTQIFEVSEMGDLSEEDKKRVMAAKKISATAPGNVSVLLLAQ